MNMKRSPTIRNPLTVNHSPAPPPPSSSHNRREPHQHSSAHRPPQRLFSTRQNGNTRVTIEPPSNSRGENKNEKHNVTDDMLIQFKPVNEQHSVQRTASSSSMNSLRKVTSMHIPTSSALAPNAATADGVDGDEDLASLVMSLYGGSIPKSKMGSKGSLRIRTVLDQARLMKCAHDGDHGIILIAHRNGVPLDALRELVTGMTLLHIAAQHGHTTLCLTLIECGVSINPVDHQGQTPVHYAAQAGKVEVLTILRRAGADLLTIDDDLHTALHIAEINRNMPVMLWMQANRADHDTCHEAVRQLTSLRFLHASNANIDVTELWTDVELAFAYPYFIRSTPLPWPDPPAVGENRSQIIFMSDEPSVVGGMLYLGNDFQLESRSFHHGVHVATRTVRHSKLRSLREDLRLTCTVFQCSSDDCDVEAYSSPYLNRVLVRLVRRSDENDLWKVSSHRDVDLVNRELDEDEAKAFANAPLNIVRVFRTRPRTKMELAAATIGSLLRHRNVVLRLRSLLAAMGRVVRIIQKQMRLFLQKKCVAMWKLLVEWERWEENVMDQIVAYARTIGTTTHSPETVRLWCRSLRVTLKTEMKYKMAHYDKIRRKRKPGARKTGDSLLYIPLEDALLAAASDFYKIGKPLVQNPAALQRFLTLFFAHKLTLAESLDTVFIESRQGMLMITNMAMGTAVGGHQIKELGMMLSPQPPTLSIHPSRPLPDGGRIRSPSALTQSSSYGETPRTSTHANKKKGLAAAAAEQMLSRRALTETEIAQEEHRQRGGVVVPNPPPAVFQCTHKTPIPMLVNNTLSQREVNRVAVLKRLVFDTITFS
eukprot:PhM_4_TR4172/c0_g1_i2/m.78482